MLIEGKSITEGSTYFSTVDPSTAEPLANMVEASATDVSAAVSAARTAFGDWSRCSVAERADLLRPFLETLQKAYGEEGEETPLKTLIKTEVGKRHPEADIEVAESGEMVEYFLDTAPRVLEAQRLTLNNELWPTKKSLVTREPIGIVGVIKPWNYPLELPIWSLIPALLGGNTVVFKPAAESSLVGLELGRMINAAVPRGVVNVITGGAETGRSLVDADVDMVSFTGSIAVGRSIAEACGSKLKRCVLELGGNDAAIVTPQADLELTANGLVWGCFANAGQVCVRPKRIFVHEEVADDLLELALSKTLSLRKDTDWAPLISEAQLAKVQRQVEGSCEQGARVLAGGNRLADSAGFYFPPTILDEVVPSMPIVSEECFGPVMSLIRFSNLDQACLEANATRYGLGASVWTSDPAEAEAIAARLDAGMAWINDVNVAFPQAPWGGRKESGIGVDLGPDGLLEYTVPKHLNFEESSSSDRDWWFPY